MEPPSLYTQVPSEFAFDARSSETGVMYYLGTMGYTQPWFNPDSQRKQVRSFASSLRRGRPSDALGLQNGDTFCETSDVPFSFIGF